MPTIFMDKDFSLLTDEIRSMPSYSLESNGSQFSFVRGSAVSSYDNGFVRAHKHSDIDVDVVTKRPHRSVKSYHEFVTTEDYEYEEVHIDYTHLNCDQLEKELTEGTNFTTMSDLVMDSFCVDNPQLFSSYRQVALLAFLRLGLGYYDSEFSGVTPSGAMKAINQGRLLLNPLRWWSIQYAFRQSRTSDINISRYYDDVERCLHANLDPTDNMDGEQVYRIPERFVINENRIFLPLAYYLEKIAGRLHSSPPLSLNDIKKLKYKFRTLAEGVITGNKTDIDRLFSR